MGTIFPVLISNSDPSIAFNLLDQALIQAVSSAGSKRELSLPGVFATLAQDGITTFPSLRAHQRHAWHAFLCQLAALALARAGRSELWEDEAHWCEALRALTPNDPDDAPWCLIAPPDRPALLQPPIPDGLAALSKTIATPDALDMLVTSRNHDLKSAMMTEAAPDDWLLALVTLQTMEGFLGAGNYGISRMNGGFASRPALGVAPNGGLGAHWRRDVQRLLSLRGNRPASKFYASASGFALLWLLPWDGTRSLRPDQLDEFYIEICRRVRLVRSGERLCARAGSSTARRVAETPGGLTGDPWAPLVADEKGMKVFSVSANGFHYRRMVQLIWPTAGEPAPLQVPAPTDGETGLTLVARALARGQGKTEGYHERLVLLSRVITRRGIDRATDPVAAAAERRVTLAGEMARVLRTALLALFQGGPERIDDRDKDGARKAQVFLTRFDTWVDRAFFDDLWREVESDDPIIERGRWVRERLLAHADTLLHEADAAAPKASRRRLRARVAAERVLHGFARRNEHLAPYFDTSEADAA